MLLEQADKHLPDTKSWFQVAVAREGVGDLEGSIAAYQRALQLDPDYDLAWFNLGGIYWNLRDFARARDTWSEAIARFPQHEQARKLQRDVPFLFDRTRTVEMIERIQPCSPSELEAQIAYLASTPVAGIARLLESGKCKLSKGVVRSLAVLGSLKTEFGQLGTISPRTNWPSAATGSLRDASRLPASAS
jgi:tetratricopeptide (TPR) repeat protein